MINIHKSKLGKSVYLTELYDYLELNKSNYTRFVRSKILNNEFAEEEKDYSSLSTTNSKLGHRGQFRKEFEIEIDFAKKLCMVSKSIIGEKIRNELVELTKEVETGLLLSPEQITFLLELIPVMGLFSIQDSAQKQHYKKHNNPYDWWEYRAKILGYGVDQLKIEVEKLNHKYKNQRQALLHIDRYELIRIGVMDLFIALGKSVEYSTNVADLCKKMALRIQLNIWNDKDISIKFPVHHNKNLEQAIKQEQLKLKQ